MNKGDLIATIAIGLIDILGIILILNTGFITFLAMFPFLFFISLTVIYANIKNYFKYKRNLAEYPIGSPGYNKIKRYYLNSIGYNPETLEINPMYDYTGTKLY